MSELAGRWLPYFVSSLVFSVLCLVIPLGGGHAATIYAGRFITGLASAVPPVVVAGSVEDVFNGKQRVWAVICWNSSTTSALCLGPIYASHIIESIGWEWVFYNASICTMVLCIALLFVQESRPSVLLGREIKVSTKTTDITDLRRTNADQAADWRAWAHIVLIRPMHVLLTEPLVIMVAIASGISWSVIYLSTDSATRIYSSMHCSETQASLMFLAIVVGILWALLPRFADMRKLRRLQAAGKPIEPEGKMGAFAYAAPSLTIGLVWFAWSVLPPPATGLHWIVPTLSLVPIGFAVVFCIAAVIFLRCSRGMRRRSPFASYSMAKHQTTQVQLD